MNRNRKKVLFIFTMALLFICAAFAYTDTTTNSNEKLSLEEKVDKLFEEWKTIDSPGAAAAIIKDNMVIYRKGFGSAQLEYNIPITPSTIFHVASVSKQFTAMAISMLEAEGKLSVNDDIRKFLPEVPDFGKTITIRHLLHHTSGMRDQWDLVILAGWGWSDLITQDQIMDMVKRQKELNFSPGERYMYCNTGYTLLAEIVSRASGKPFTQWTQENIFKPLGMTSTHFHDDNQQIVKNRAYSYDKDEKKGLQKSILNYATVGATSLFTTVEDLANWVRNFEEKRVGGAKVIELMLTKGVLNNGIPITYARGIQVLDYKGLKILTHDGGDAGFRSSLLYFPDQKFGVMVLANLGSIQPGGLARKIADIYLADQLKQPEPGKKPAKIVKISPKKLKIFSGIYWLESSKQVRKIFQEGEKLYYVWSDTYRTELAPISQTEFIMKGIGVEVTVGFSDRTKDRYDTIMVTAANRPPLKGKWLEPFNPTTELLEEYTGRYYSEELDFHYDLVLEKDELFMKARNSGDKPLKALIKDYFTTYYGSFKIEFRRNPQGAVTGFNASSNRVLNLRFKKVNYSQEKRE
jgi:CubicO group peptidase (beta-lactamase class C family)